LAKDTVAQFESVRRETLADTVYWKIRQAIMNGEIADGAELNQVTLSRQFNVSRVPVREALRRLQAERLVTVTPYQQYAVSAVRPEAVLELIGIREQLEIFAVRRHIATLTPEAVDEMLARNAALRKEPDHGSWLQGDWELHELIDGRGTEAARLVGDLRDRIHRYLTTVASSPARQKQACAEHERIINAMRDGDADSAETALREHIAHTRNIIVTKLIEMTPPPETANDTRAPAVSGAKRS
jgi:DNA-binding GntR family transcriptional regulator